MSGAQVQFQALGKVNISLSVGRPRADGMHPIVSKMTTIGLYDDLEVTRLEDHALSRYAILKHEDASRVGTIDWSVTSDLAVLAHRAVEVYVGHTLPVQLKLQKRIPVGGGLGGGSSDAAAMLKAITILFELDLNLVEIAATIGSDVPFFIDGGCAIVSGIGETIEKIEEEQRQLVLVLPEYNCSTVDVYRSFDALGCGKIESSRVRGGEMFNDLFAAACQVSSKLAEDTQVVRAIAGSDVHLSGSGSTMFVICDNAQHATELANSIEENTNLVALATHTCACTDVLEE